MRYAFTFTLSFFALLWERLWRRFWPSVTLLLFYAALALLGVAAAVGTVWHMVFLALFAAALTITLLKTSAPFTFPSRGEVERRMERRGGLAHRPLQALRDKPAKRLAPDTAPLWQKHLDDARRALKGLKIYRPQTDVSRRDRFALRYAALLLFVIGLAMARHDAAPRLRQAFTFDAGTLIQPQVLTLDLWITPPAYTHDPAVFLSTADQGIAAQNGPLHVPAGSLLKLRLSKPRFAPRISYAGEKIPAANPAPRNYTLDMRLDRSGRLTISNLFHRLGTWQIDVLPDTPPTVRISKIDATRFAAVKITYAANDDHGITKLTGIVGANGHSYTFALPPTTGADETSVMTDLTANPAAGERVEIWLDAEDGAGHITSSLPVSFTLPERHFNNPLAQQIILDRKILLHNKGVATHQSVAQDLFKIADKPGLYKGDFTVFLGLSSAIRRLRGGRHAATPPSVIGLLWNIALRLDDGGVTHARDALENALQHLSQALADKSASKQQMQTLLDNVRKAMRTYLKTLAGEMAQKLMQGKNAPHLSPELTEKLLRNIDVSTLVAQMQALSNANSLEAMEKMAAALRNTLNNFNINDFDRLQKQQAQTMEALQNLQDIIHRQQNLLVETDKTTDKAKLRKQRHTQYAIRHELEQSVKKLATTGLPVPDSLSGARVAMQKSAAALAKARREASLAEQKAALDDLQKGLDKTTKKVAAALQQALLPFGMMTGGNYGAGYDPLGRPYGISSGALKLPDQSRQRRVQKIIQELQQRESDPARSDIEHDYVHRLLDQF